MKDRPRARGLCCDGRFLWIWGEEEGGICLPADRLICWSEAHWGHRWQGASLVTLTSTPGFTDEERKAEVMEEKTMGQWVNGGSKYLYFVNTNQEEFCASTMQVPTIWWCWISIVFKRFMFIFIWGQLCSDHRRQVWRIIIRSLLLSIKIFQNTKPTNWMVYWVYWS